MRQLARAVTDQKPFQVAFEWMQAIAGQIKGLRRRGGVENWKDSLNGFQEVGAYAASIATIEAFQASMFEAPNHQALL
jgi:hypothetical protein